MTQPNVVAVMELSRRMQDSHCLDPYHTPLKKTPGYNTSAYFPGCGGTVEALVCFLFSRQRNKTTLSFSFVTLYFCSASVHREPRFWQQKEPPWTLSFRH